MKNAEDLSRMVAEGGVRLEGALVTCTDEGRAEAIELVRVAA